MKVGDQVVCVRTDKLGLTKKGCCYTIYAMNDMPCGCVVIDVGMESYSHKAHCAKHTTSKILTNGVRWFLLYRFAPIVRNSAMDELLNKEIVEEKLDCPIKEPVN